MEILLDKSKSGKARPWKKNKNISQLIAGDFLKLQEEGRFIRMASCGCTLVFDTCPADGRKFLTSANFCRERQCSMCIWRRSKLVAGQVQRVCHQILQENPTYKFLLLTLTVPNVLSEELDSTITHLMASWKRLSERKDFEVIKGYFRALEVKYNGEKGFHPHFHAIICVPPSYFSGQNYIKQARWLELWREATRQPEITQVDIRRLKKKKWSDSEASGAVEAAKYSVKMDDIANLEDEERLKVLKDVHISLKHRRLYAYGGLMKEVHKKLNLSNENEASNEDLVTLGEDKKECHCDICGGPLMKEVFHWMKDNYYQG